MATILEFRQSPGEARRKGSRRRGRAAEIVIFPGVRYERWSEGEASPKDKAVPNKSRDFLKIVD